MVFRGDVWPVSRSCDCHVMYTCDEGDGHVTVTDVCDYHMTTMWGAHEALHVQRYWYI